MEPSLYSFIRNEKANRRYLLLAVGCAIVQIVIFKLLYPFPDFISDSYDYIESAALHRTVSLWPVAYAKFLWFIHQISVSDLFLVCVQYFLMEAALAYLFFFIRWMFNPSRISANILFVFLLVNPLSLYLSNAVLSDSLFTALSIVMLVQLMYQFKRPSVSRIFLAAALMGILFTIRYAALFYPLVMPIALLLTRQKLWVRIAGTLAPFVIIVPFVLFTEGETKKITGTAEFSVFSGWQIANNALYMYDHIHVDPRDLPAGTRSFDTLVKAYFKAAPPGYFDFDDFPGTFFIKHQHAPLKQYTYMHYLKTYDTSSFLAWGRVSPLYNTYGNYLIRHYPIPFARYYLWYNAKKYFDPFLEKFGTYNLEEDSAWEPAQYWFHWKTPAVRSVSKDFQGNLFFFYPPIFALLNVYFVACMLWLLFTGRIGRLDPVFRRTLYFISGYVLVNFAFSVYATPICLRHEIISMTMLFIFSILLLEFTDLKAPEKEAVEKSSHSESAKHKESALVAFSIFIPGGLLGALFCMIVILLEAVFNLFCFIFLLGFGFCSLVYGYLMRQFRHFHFRHPSV